MLRRRILASSMASVMALTSVVGVAFAADTDVAVDTKAGLQKYVDSFEDFLEDGINDYGEKAAEDFQAAYDHANVVLEDDKAKAADYAAAYAMLETMRSQMVAHDAVELEGLIKDCTSAYKTENVLNEALGDKIYKDAEWADFEVAYEDAEYYVESDDSRIITEAYINLDKAYEALLKAKLATVRKADYRKAYNDYQKKIIGGLNLYETWRRGKATVKTTKGEKGSDSAVPDITKREYVSYAELYDIVYGESKGAKEDALGNKLGTFGTTGMYIKIPTGMSTIAGSINTIHEFVQGGWDVFDENKESAETSNTEIIAAYNAAVDAVKVYDGWKVDNVKSGSESSVRGLLKDYHDKLALNFNEDETLKVLNAIADGDDSGSTFTTDTLTLENAKAAKATWVKLASEKNVIGTNWFAEKTTNYFDEVVKNTSTEGFVALSKGANILKYVNVGSENITGTPKNAAATGLRNATTTTAPLQNAVELAELYLTQAGTKAESRDWTAVETLKNASSGKKVTDLHEFAKSDFENAGAGEEWTIVYRFLKYALNDAYKAPDTTSYKKVQVKELINKSYDLIEEAGDVSVFSDQTNALYQAISCATEWVSETDAMKKEYKDNEPIKEYKATHYVGTSAAYKCIDGEDQDTDGDNKITCSSTQAYKFLNGYYEDLKDELAAYAVSYRTIKDLIGDVKADIVNGKITGTDALDKALKTCANDLLLLESKDTPDNDPFNDDGEFNEYARLLTAENNAGKKPNDGEKALKTAYDNLLKEYDAAKKGESLEPNVNGDTVVDTNDVAELMKLVLSNKADVSKHDFNGDKVVDVLDAKQLLTDILAGKYNA